MIDEQPRANASHIADGRQRLVGVEGTFFATSRGQAAYRCLGFVTPKAGRRKLRLLYSGKPRAVWLQVFVGCLALFMTHGLLMVFGLMGLSRILDVKLPAVGLLAVTIVALVFGLRTTLQRYGELGRRTMPNAGSWLFSTAGLVWSEGDVERVFGGHLDDMDTRVHRLGGHQSILRMQREVWRCRLLMARELVQLGCSEIIKSVGFARQ